jgi:hypothetical protein
MRTTAILLAAILASTLPAVEASERKQIHVRAQVSAVVKVRHADMVGAVEVPAAAHGELFVPQAVTFDVFCNTGSFELDFRIADPAVEEVAVSGLDAPVRVGHGGGSARVNLAPEARLARRTLHYHVRYAAGTPPGPRPAPLAVAVRPHL